jgi:hypothetical protein
MYNLNKTLHHTQNASAMLRQKERHKQFVVGCYPSYHRIESPRYQKMQVTLPAFWSQTRSRQDGAHEPDVIQLCYIADVAVALLASASIAYCMTTCSITCYKDCCRHSVVLVKVSTD